MFEELMQYEPNFQESMFKTKVDNIFVTMMSSIMRRDITRSYSSLSEEVRSIVNGRIDTLLQSNEIQMYDELNVKSTEVTGFHIDDEFCYLDVLLVSRYMDYQIDANTKSYLRGNNQSRDEHKNYLTFRLKKNHRDLSKAVHCPMCNANIDYNYSGCCEYCGSQLPKEEYDWILSSWRQV